MWRSKQILLDQNFRKSIFASLRWASDQRSQRLPIITSSSARRGLDFPQTWDLSCDPVSSHFLQDVLLDFGSVWAVRNRKCLDCLHPDRHLVAG